MAITYFGSVAIPTDNGTNATATITPTPPASMLEGDLVVVVCRQRGTGVWTNGLTGGQTWTNEGNNTGTANISINTFWCRFNGTWNVNPRFDNSGATNTSLVLFVFRPTSTNYNWTLEFDNVTNGTATTLQTITGITPTHNNNVSIASWHTADDNTWGTLTGTNWTKGTLSAQYRNLAGSDGSCTYAYQIQSTAGATNNVAQTQLTLGADATARRILNFYETIIEVVNGSATPSTLTTTSTLLSATASGSVVINAQADTSVISSAYALNDSNQAGNSNASLNAINSNYALNSILVSANSATSQNVLSGTYAINSATVTANSTTALSVFGTIYSLNTVSVSVNSVINQNVLIGTYNLGVTTASSSSSATTPVNILGLSYAIHNVSVSASSSVAQNVLNNTYSINTVSINASAQAFLSVINAPYGINSVNVSTNGYSSLEALELSLSLRNVIIQTSSAENALIDVTALPLNYNLHSVSLSVESNIGVDVSLLSYTIIDSSQIGNSIVSVGCLSLEYGLLNTNRPFELYSYNSFIENKVLLSSFISNYIYLNAEIHDVISNNSNFTNKKDLLSNIK